MASHLIIRTNKQCDLAVREALREHVEFTAISFIWNCIFIQREKE